MVVNKLTFFLFISLPPPFKNVSKEKQKGKISPTPPFSFSTQFHGKQSEKREKKSRQIVYYHLSYHSIPLPFIYPLQGMPLNFISCYITLHKKPRYSHTHTHTFINLIICDIILVRLAVVVNPLWIECEG